MDIDQECEAGKTFYAFASAADAESVGDVSDIGENDTNLRCKSDYSSTGSIINGPNCVSDEAPWHGNKSSVACGRGVFDVDIICISVEHSVSKLCHYLS